MSEPRNPSANVVDLSTAYFVSRVLHVVAELGVADALGDAPMTAAELAAKTGANADAMFRALRLLASHGVFEMSGDRFTHSEASRLLRQDHPRSLRPWVRMMGSPLNWNTYGLFEHTMRTGKPGRDELIEGDFFADYLPKHPDLGKLFDESMTSAARQRIPAIVGAYDFSGFATIADIGGGRGHLIDAVLAATPSAKGILFDLKHVVARAERRSGDRLTIMGGSFFDDPLPLADAYLVMHVIHDWSDEESIQILKALHRAAPKHAKLLMIERVVTDGPGSEHGKRMDIHMLAALSGRERTHAEFERLFAASGFSLDRVTPTAAGASILEGTPR
ncbi:MAG: methyltransferase [Alphaproteobacteria bacterium]